jgi:hypothetical protein
MKRVTAVLGYAGAALTIAAAVAAPFVLFDLFTRGVAATGVHVDPVYSGGVPARTISRGGYRIIVNRPVVPRAPLARGGAFVQVAWTPVSALPARVVDAVDVDGDGRDDLVARFDVPGDPQARLFIDVTPASGQVLSMRRVSQASFTCLIARVGDRIVARIPLAPRR